MIHYVSVSGGRTSAYQAFLFEDLKKLCPELDVRYIFMDTGAEHPETYIFLKNLVSYLNIELTVLRVVFSPLYESNSYKIEKLENVFQDLSLWEEMLTIYGSPAINIPFCTGRLKTEPYEKFVKDDCQGEDYMTWLGIRSDEPRRLKPKDNIGYLANLSDFEKEDILNFFKKFEWDLKIPEHLGNCEFCIKKDVAKIALAQRHEPDHAEKWRHIVESDKVRKEDRLLKDFSMYRGKNSFSNIIKMFEDTSDTELEEKLNKSKRFDSGSCSESCEAI